MRPVRIGQHSGATSAAAESTTHGTRAELVSSVFTLPAYVTRRREARDARI